MGRFPHGQTETSHMFTDKEQDRHWLGSFGDMQVIWSKISFETGDIWIMAINVNICTHFLSNFDGYIKKM